MSGKNQRKLYRWVAEEGEGGLRIDQFIASRDEDLSRTLARRLVDAGGVHVDGRRIRRCSHLLSVGERVEVHIDGLPLDPYPFGQQDVLFRDRWLLAINKPSGLETQPTPARYKGTLYDLLLRFLQDPHRPRLKPELGMVQRLDRETSGVMLFSIHKRAHRPLTEGFAGRSVAKRYLALVSGGPQEPEGEIRSLLARRRATNLVRSVKKGGKEAITRYRVVESFDGAALVEIELLTGRSHQIRAHFSELGHPLLGDTRYGGPATLRGHTIPRQMLHAWRLALPHPVTGEPLDLEATLPADMTEILNLLRSGATAPENIPIME